MPHSVAVRGEERRVSTAARDSPPPLRGALPRPPSRLAWWAATMACPTRGAVGQPILVYSPRVVQAQKCWPSGWSTRGGRGAATPPVLCKEGTYWCVPLFLVFRLYSTYSTVLLRIWIAHTPEIRVPSSEVVHSWRACEREGLRSRAAQLIAVAVPSTPGRPHWARPPAHSPAGPRRRRPKRQRACHPPAVGA